jgi:Type I phosphodiesterase / nucleotide pyrophosphatase
MASRSLVAVGLLSTLLLPGRSWAEGPPRTARNVIIVTLDGFRPQEFFAGADESLVDAKAGGVADPDDLKRRYWRQTAGARREALLPFIWTTVARNGQVFGDRSRNAPAAVTNGLKFSYPGYHEIFCGFGDPRIDSNDKKPNPNRSVLEFLNERPPYRGRVAVIGTWDVYPFIFRSGENGLFVHAGWVPIADEPLSDRQRQANRMMQRLPRYWPDNVYDVITMEAASEHLRRHAPRVLYIALGETDEWAHERRYDLYLDAAHAADAFLRDLWAAVQERPEYRDQTALVLTTDHGRGGGKADWIDHDRDVPGAEAIWIAVMGPGTPPLGVREGVATTQSQVAATIAGLLGEDFVAASPKSARPLPGVGSATMAGTPR